MAGTRLAGGGRLWMVEVKREGGRDGGESREGLMMSIGSWQEGMADGQARFRQAVRRKESIAKSETFRLRKLSDTGRQASDEYVAVAVSSTSSTANQPSSHQGTSSSNKRIVVVCSVVYLASCLVLG